MKGNDLSRQLSDLPEEMIAEAMAPAKTIRRKHTTTRILRLTAIAAALAILITAVALWPTEENYITGPGVLVVRAYAADTEEFTEENSVVLEEGITFPKISWSLLSNQPGFPVVLSIPENEYDGKDIRFEITVSHGSLLGPAIGYRDENGNFPDNFDTWKSRCLGNHFTRGNNSMLYFRPGYISFDDDTRQMHFTRMEGFRSLVDIIIYADDYIVGYAVIEFYEIVGDSFEKLVEEGYEPMGVVKARVLEIRSFPQIDGKYQKVTREYVEAQFERIMLAAEGE